ncbi:sec7 domain-containing protein, partial [Cystoisospora suis]
MAGSGTLRGPATSVALLPEGCDRGQTASSLAESVSEVPRRISDSSVEEEDLRVHASPTTPHASCCHSSSVVLVDGTLSRNGAGICRSNGDEERLRREGSVCPFDDTRRGGYKEPEGIIGAGGDRMGPSALDREPDFVVDSHRVPTRSPSGEVVEATAEGSPGPELQGLNRRERSVVSAARRDDATSLGFVGNDGPLSVGKANGGRPQFASLEHDGKTCDGHTDTRVVQDAAFAVPVLSPSPPHAPLSCRPLTPTLSSSSRTSPPPTSASLVSYIKHSLQRLEKVAGSTRKPKGLKEACCRALGAFERLVKRRERTRRLFRDADGWSKAAGISSAGRGAGADCLAELEKVGGKTGEQRNSEQAREQSGEDCSGTVKSEETIGEQRALAEGEDTKPPVAAHGQEQQKPPQGGQPDPAFTAGARAVAQPGEGDRSVTTVLSSQHGTESHSDLGVSQAAKKGTGGFVGSAPHAERQTTVQGADMKERSSFFVEMDQTEESAVEVEDLESMFEPFQLACESNNPRLQYPALEGLHRILVTNFLAPSVFLCPSSTAMSRRLSAPTECLEGETVELPRANDVAALAIPSSTVVSREETQRANCVQCPRDNQPCSTGDSSELLQTLAVSDSLRSPQIPPSSVSSSSSSLFFTTRQTDSDSSPAAQPYKQDQQLDSSPAASTKPPLIDRVAAAICKCSESADEPVVLQALRCLLTAVSSPYLELHGGALLSAVRALFEVFGNCQRSAENQRTAQAALLHTVRTVMQRYECGAVSSFPRESLLPERALRARASYCSASGAREREDPRFSRGEPWGGQGERGLAKESTPETVTGEFAEGEARNTEEVVLSTGKAKKRTRLGSAGQEEQDTAHTCAARKEHADDSVPVSGVTGEEAGSAFAGCSADQLIGDQGQAGSYKEREDELQGLQSRAIPEERPTGGGVDAVLGQRTRTVAELSVPVAVREQSGPSAPAFSCPSVTSCGFPCSLSSTPPPRHPASSSSSFASPLSQGPFQRATTRPSQSSLQLRDVLLVLQALCRLAACEDPSGSTGGGSSRFTGSGFVGSLGSLVGGGSGGSTKFGGDGGRKATKKLALELTRDMLQASGERLRSSRLFLSFLKQHLFVTLIRSVVVPSLCAVSLDIFLFLVQRHYHHLGHETAVFFSELLVRLLLSPNIPMDQREVILSSLAEFFVVTPASFTLGLFLDFDCSVEEKDVVLPLLETLCSQAVKPAKGDD